MKTKKILFTSILIFSVFILNLLVPANADVCFLPEGTYTGLALVSGAHGKEKWPFFAIVANKRLTGFYAPEDQTHPSGATINQTDIKSGFTFFLTTDKKENIKLNFVPTSPTKNGLPIGKAKLITVKDGSSNNKGYYRPFLNSFSDDFLSIGSDGALVARVTGGMDFIFFFGKINTKGKFVQVFPNKDQDINLLSIDFSGDEATLIVENDEGDKFNIKMQKKESGSCSPESVIANDLLTKAFIENLSDLTGLIKELIQTGKPIDADEFTKIIDGQVNLINSYISFHLDPKQCNDEIVSSLLNIRSVINHLKIFRCIKNEASEKNNCIAANSFDEKFTKIKDLFKRTFDGFKIDDDSNEIPDICETHI